MGICKVNKYKKENPRTCSSSVNFTFYNLKKNKAKKRHGKTESWPTLMIQFYFKIKKPSSRGIDQLLSISVIQFLKVLKNCKRRKLFSHMILW